VRLLLQQIGKRRDNGLSHVIIVSILVKPGSFFGDPVNLKKDFDNCNIHLRPKLFIADEDVLSEIAGFPVARGAMACGIPLRVDEEMLLDQMAPKALPEMRILALDGISNMANMGSIIRCAAAFGVHAMVLSKDCCDPWYRRSVRVSMGYISQVPIMRLQEHDDLRLLIRKLRDKGIHSYAAVVDDETSLLESFDKGDVAESWCCVLGNEANGVKKSVADECDHKLRIGMVDGVDSLSVSIAAGVMLHGLVEKTRR
jgi:tRNA G18 (ribose-2'-O)-methylase SpoU